MNKLKKRLISCVALTGVFLSNISILPSANAMLYPTNNNILFATKQIQSQNKTETNNIDDAAYQAATLAQQYGQASAVQYAIWQKGDIIASGSTGVFSKNENRMLTDNDLYGIGSISKVYTTAAMLKLVEQGKISLDTPVVKYLPEFKMQDERYRKITVRMLLNHSSGLPGGTIGNGFLFDDMNNDRAMTEFLSRLSNQRLQANPGEYSVYNNDGFTLAELVIEKVSGMSFTEFIKKELLNPLGLKQTFTPKDNFDTTRLVKTYIGNDTKELPQDTIQLIGTGGIYSTASEVAAFGGALCSNELLNQNSLNEMETDYTKNQALWPENSEDDALAFGLGWDNIHVYPFNQSGIKALSKCGDTQFYHASLVILPEYDMAAAVLSSGGISTYNQAAASKMLVSVLEEQGISVAANTQLPPAEPSDMPKELLSLAGDYASSMMVGKIDLTPDGEMTIDIVGSTPIKAYYHNDGSFRNKEQTMLFRLVKEDNGQVYLFQQAYSNLPNLVPIGAANYVMERLPDYTPKTDVLKAWEQRNNSLWLLVNETYKSQFYAMGSAISKINLENSKTGYWAYNQLIDANTSVPFVQIAGTGSRDVSSVKFFTENNINYMTSNGMIFQDEKSISNIFAGQGGRCTIGNDGLSRWYRIGSAGNKNMTVQLPETGEFYVYGNDFTVKGSSMMTGNSIKLPENGWIVFAGEPETVFKIDIK